MRVAVRAGLTMAWFAVFALAGCGNDVDFDARVPDPAYAKGTGPVVLFDQGHHNRHELGGSYKPFATLAENDGFQVREFKESFTLDALKRGAILVIVAAQSQTDTNAESAFTTAEIRAVADWVKAGGSLLLVTDHYPFPNAAEGLAAAFGLEVGKGMVFDEQHYRQGSKDESRLIFSRQNGLLASHAITTGAKAGDRVDLVETFTGDAFKPRDPSAIVLRLAPSAQVFVGVPEIRRSSGDTAVDVKFVNPRSGAGWGQAVAFQFGAGRVVAVAEAAALTAQADGGRRLGMNAPGNDNRIFVLNIMGWLGRAP